MTFLVALVGVVFGSVVAFYAAVRWGRFGR